MMSGVQAREFKPGRLSNPKYHARANTDLFNKRVLQLCVEKNGFGVALYRCNGADGCGEQGDQPAHDEGEIGLESATSVCFQIAEERWEESCGGGFEQ